MKNLFFVSVLLCVVSAPLHAQNVYQWFGSSSSNWADPLNWYTEIGLNPGTFGAIPEDTAKVKINNVLWEGIYFPIIGGENGTQDIAIGDIFMVDAGWLTPASLTVAQGGSFSILGAGGTAQGQLNIAYAPGGTATVTVDGGAVNIAGPMHVGWGGTGYVKIKSGSITVDSFDIGGAGGTGNIDIEAGTLRVNGQFDVQIFTDPIILIYPPPYLAGLTGYGDPENIRWTYDEIADQTIIWAVPEPASIALLGLGLMFLRKRE
jgi:T5SS/PEP-CTERM-associated repeat protein